MKLLALFLMIPLVTFSNVEKFIYLEQIPPDSLKPGMSVVSISKSILVKSTKLADRKISYDLKINAIHNIPIRKASTISEEGTITHLLLMFDKKNGKKFLEYIVSTHPIGKDDVMDVYEWTIDNVVIEIHETVTGYAATYRLSNLLTN